MRIHANMHCMLSVISISAAAAAVERRFVGRLVCCSCVHVCLCVGRLSLQPLFVFSTQIFMYTHATCMKPSPLLVRLIQIHKCSNIVPLSIDISAGSQSVSSCFRVCVRPIFAPACVFYLIRTIFLVEINQFYSHK